MHLSRPPSFVSFFLLMIVSIILAGCECFPCDEVQPIIPMYPYVQMAPTPPPEPLHEYVTIPESPSSYLWRPGYWIYNGQSFDWIPGQLIMRPSPTAVWSQDHWIEHTYGWVFLPGYWQ